MSFLQLENIDFYYKNKNNITINNLNIIFRSGYITALIGSNGSGKTTLLKIISGLIYPKFGKIKINDILISKKNILYYKYFIGFMPEYLNLYSDMKVGEVLQFLSRLKYTKKKIKIINEILGLLNLLQYKNKKIKTLSKGMKQRLNLAQSLILKPFIVLLDEPSNGLDYISILVFYKILNILSSYGSIIILSSHHLNEIYSNVDKVIVLSGGIIIKEINTNELNFDEIEIFTKVYFFLQKSICLKMFLRFKKLYKKTVIDNNLTTIAFFVKQNKVYNLISDIHINRMIYKNIKVENNEVKQTFLFKILNKGKIL